MKTSTEILLRAIFATVMVSSAAIFGAAKDPIAVSLCGELPDDAVCAEKRQKASSDEPYVLTSLEKRIEESRRAVFGTGHLADDQLFDVSGLTTEPLTPFNLEFKIDYSDGVFQRGKLGSPSAFRYVPENVQNDNDLNRSLTWQRSDERRRDLPPRNDLIDETKDLATDQGFQWRPAIYQSFMMMAIQHGYAIGFQEKTRRALKGPFFRDYWNSVKGLDGWDDGNKFFTNYIAHPMQGALTGFIYLQNQPRTRNQRFGMSKEYWHDRLIAFVWSTAWSTQWELGPISQSSIGNVGLYGGMGYVDLVITPTVGTAWLVTEEALDRYVISKWERRGWTMKVIARMLLNPMRTIANLLRFQVPWYRERPVGYSRVPVDQLGGR